MNINATIIVQVFNFWVAYLMIRFILLKPAAEIMDQDEVYLNSLQLDADLKKNDLDQKEQSRIKIQKTYQKKFLAIWPNLKEQEQRFVVECPKEPQINDKDLIILSKDISNDVSKRIFEC